MKISDLRREYARAELDEASTDADPCEQFRRWFAEAREGALLEVNAMTLATVDVRGRPSARTVLLKGFDHKGFVFFTDYRSVKSQDLLANPHAALLFHWPELERQVRLVGTVERTTADESWEYFRTRPTGSRLGAWASHQSQLITGRDALEEAVRVLAVEFADREIPLPPHWGGFRVRPDTFEFWQGRPDRLHDRIQYTDGGGGSWTRARLSP